MLANTGENVQFALEKPVDNLKIVNRAATVRYTCAGSRVRTRAGGGSNFSDKFRLELHCTDTVNFTVNIMIAVAQANAFDLGADFDYQ